MILQRPLQSKLKETPELYLKHRGGDDITEGVNLFVGFICFILKQLDVKFDCDDSGLGLEQLECPRDGASPLLAASEDLTHPDLRPAQKL